MEELSQHIKEDEATDLVKLEEALSDDESESLSKSFGRTKMFIPSRSHPSAPSKPPYVKDVARRRGLRVRKCDRAERDRWEYTSL